MATVDDRLPRPSVSPATSPPPPPNSPEISVVIPTRDRWELFSANALRAALLQEDVEFEVIVVDDGSTDETPAKLAEREEPQLRVLRHSTAQGVSRARNAGITEARGEWLAFLDDDDIWSPRKLRTQLDAAKASGASFVYSSVVVLDEKKRALSAVPAPDPINVSRLLLTRNVVPGGGSGAIAHADLVRRLGGFDERLFLLEEWDLWVRLASVGRAAACPETLVGYVKHQRNLTLEADPNAFLRELDYMIAKYRTLGRQLGVDFDRVELSRWLSREHFRAGQLRRGVYVWVQGALGPPRIRNLRTAFALELQAFLRQGYDIPWKIRGRGVSRTMIVEEPGWLALYR